MARSIRVVEATYDDLWQRILETWMAHVGPREPLPPKPALVLEEDAGDGGRHFGYYVKDEHLIAVSPDLADALPSIIRGILAHELGHALAALLGQDRGRSHDDEERQADALAEQFTGLKIFYGRNDLVQRAGRGAGGGIRPRPLGLR